MSESRLIQEIPKSGVFHSAVMTTFSFDFNHFEAQVLRVLRQRGLTSFNVLMDTTMLDKCIGFSTGHLKSIANYYSVHTVPCTGAFHPKILFLAGEKEVMFVQGSGNMTTAGHGKKHELFTAFYANEENQEQLPIIEETWLYLKRLMSHVKGVASWKLEALEENCALLKSTSIEGHQWHKIDSTLSVAALYNGESSLWNQVINLLPTEDITNIKVFCPYYDENGALLERIASHFKCTVQAFMQEGRGIHPHRMPSADDITFLNWDSTQRSTNLTKKFKRRLHAKIFWFDAGYRQFCITGSANCTRRAFGSVDRRGVNDEYALLYELNDKKWLEELGLTGNFESIQAQSNESTQNYEKELEEEQERNARKIRILGIDQNEELLTVYLKLKDLYQKANLSICNCFGEVIEQKELKLDKPKIRLLISKDIYKGVAYAFLEDKGGRVISNKQVVNTFLDKWNSDPSRENRDFIKLMSNIEVGKNKLFDMVDFMNTLYRRDTDSVQNQAISPSSTSEKKEVKSPVSMTYAESLELESKNQESQKIVHHHNAVQLFDAVERYFKESAREEEEEDMDDEEDLGSATTGRKRKERKEKGAPVRLRSKNVLSNRRKKTVKFFGNYSATLGKGLAIEGHRTSLVDLAMYLLVLRHLVNVGGRKIELKKPSDGTLDEENVLFPIQGNYKELGSVNSVIYNLIGKFITFVSKAPFAKPLDTYSEKKFEKYLIFARERTLFILSTIRSYYPSEDQRACWYDLLAYNVLEVFGPLEKDYTKRLNNIEDYSFKGDINQDEVRAVLEKWQREFLQINSKKNLIKLQDFGICLIHSRIPEQGETKFVRLARPGFSFNEDYSDFALTDLYQLKTGRFVSSLQNLKKV